MNNNNNEACKCRLPWEGDTSRCRVVWGRGGKAIEHTDLHTTRRSGKERKKENGKKKIDTGMLGSAWKNFPSTGQGKNR